jgi:hypothetical protein
MRKIRNKKTIEPLVLKEFQENIWDKPELEIQILKEQGWSESEFEENIKKECNKRLFKKFKEEFPDMKILIDGNLVTDEEITEAKAEKIKSKALNNLCDQRVTYYIHQIKKMKKILPISIIDIGDMKEFIDREKEKGRKVTHFKDRFISNG